MPHPLTSPSVRDAITRAAARHWGRPWTMTGFVDLDDRASHPSGILRGTVDGGATADVFAKLDPGSGTAAFDAELRGLGLIAERSTVAVPAPIGVITTDPGPVLLLEAVREIPARDRTPAHWRSVGYALATLHGVHADAYGLADFDGYFGPLPQVNDPIAGATWAEFHSERRLRPNLRLAVDTGHLPPELAAGVDRVADRLPGLCGPEPRPSLLHGDAQQNNLLTTADGAVLVDTAPHYGHPEVDLALIDYFAPVPPAVFEAYAEVEPIADDFADRRELWRLFAYLAVVAVDGDSDFGRPFIGRIGAVVWRYG